jgi:HDOD domain
MLRRLCWVDLDQYRPYPPGFIELADFEFPDLPILPETLLLLDLKTQDPWIDLANISHVLLRDVGATTQILRLAGREYADAKFRPIRIEDCIADLGLEACVEAVSTKIVAQNARNEAIVGLWTHSREIAEQASAIAEDMPGVDPAQAYLAGLMHAIDELPSLLGWSDPLAELAADKSHGISLAEIWSLPACVCDLFSAPDQARTRVPWSRIVHAAHAQLGVQSFSAECSLTA